MDDIVLLGQDYSNSRGSSNFFGNFGLSGMRRNMYNQITTVRGRRLTGTELSLLGDSSFTYDRKKRGFLYRAVGATVNALSLGATGMATGSRRSGLKDVSRGLTLRGVSQSDFQDLLSLDLFRGGSLGDVVGTSMSKATYKQDRRTGQVARTSGVELSLLDEAGFERLSQVVSARQGEILNRSLTPGLSTQSMSLFSGNF